MRKVVILALAVVLIAGCTTSGGDSDKAVSDAEKIESVIDEFVEGWTEGTRDALENKVFPHISDNYSHAGLDRDGYIEDALEKIERRRVDVVDYSIEHDIDVNGDTATDKFSLSYQGLKKADLDTPFDASVDAEIEQIATLKKEGGEWKIVSVETVSGESHGEGAVEGSSAPKIENLVITPSDSIAPGGEVQVSGQIVFPEKAEGELLASVEIGLQWDYKRPNAKYRWSGNEITFLDRPDPEGTYEFSVTLPVDGEPQADIPGTFPAGTDSMAVSVIVNIAEDAGDDIEPVAAAGQTKVLKLENFENESVECSNEPLDEASHEGIWRMLAQVTTDIHFFELLDLASLGDSYCVLLTLPGHGDNEPIAVAACGELNGDTFTGSEELEIEGCPPDDPKRFDVQLSFSGLAATGTAVFSGCAEPPINLALSGEKVSNRCEFLWHPDAVEGAWTSAKDEEPVTVELTYTGHQKFDITISTSGEELEGLEGRAFSNSVEVYPSDDPDEQVAQIAFDSADSGTLFLYEDGDLVLTSRIQKQ